MYKHKDELDNGNYFLIGRAHMIAGFVFLMISTGITVGTLTTSINSRLADHERRIELVERNERQAVADNNERVGKLNEISFNLRNICKKMNLDYIENTEHSK